MLRFASSIVIAVYATVRLIPQDRERKPSPRLRGDGAPARKKTFFLAGTCGPEGGESIARLACSLFTKPSHFHDF
jgi:hypothetical protein